MHTYGEPVPGTREDKIRRLEQLSDDLERTVTVRASFYGVADYWGQVKTPYERLLEKARAGVSPGS